MIIYGSFTETSVAQLFMAGVVPGLLLTTMFMVYVAVHAMFFAKNKPIEEKVTLLGRIRALADILPFAVLIGGTMGSMYFGLVTPTEAAAVGCALAVVISRDLGQSDLARAAGLVSRHDHRRRQHLVHRLCGAACSPTPSAWAASASTSPIGSSTST